MFFGIDWIAFVVVTLASLISTLIVVGLFSFGVRLLAISQMPTGEIADVHKNAETAGDSGTLIFVNTVSPRKHFWAKLGSQICFFLSAVAVLIGIILIIPQLHGFFLP